MEVFCVNNLFIENHVSSEDGYLKTAAYTKFIDKITEPADVLCIAGSIGFTTNGIVQCILGACKLFDKVIWTPGQTDLKMHLTDVNAYNKIDKIKKFVKNNSKTGQVEILDYSVCNYQGISFGGGMGMFDSKGLEDSFANEFKALEVNTWTEDAEAFAKSELKNLHNVLGESHPIFSMSSYAPQQFVRKYEGDDLARYTFNSTKIPTFMNEGDFYHFGNVPMRKKYDVKVSGKTITVIDNFIGPDKRLDVKNKRDFLVTV